MPTELKKKPAKTNGPRPPPNRRPRKLGQKRQKNNRESIGKFAHRQGRPRIYDANRYWRADLSEETSRQASGAVLLSKRRYVGLHSRSSVF